jgi:hypothetical protein
LYFEKAGNPGCEGATPDLTRHWLIPARFQRPFAAASVSQHSAFVLDWRASGECGFGLAGAVSFTAKSW